MLSLVVFISCACHLWKGPDAIVGGIIVVAVGCGMSQLDSEPCPEIWSRGEHLGAVVSGNVLVIISCACQLWKCPDAIVCDIIVVAVGCGINQLCSETCSEIWSRGECLGAVVSGIVLVMVTSWLWILRVVRLVTRYGRETCDGIVT